MNCRVRFTRISKYCLEVRFKHKLHLIWVYFMSIASLLILQSTRLSRQYYFLVLQKNCYNIGADTQYNAYCLFSKKDFNEMKIYFMIEIIIKRFSINFTSLDQYTKYSEIRKKNILYINNQQNVLSILIFLSCVHLMLNVK